MVPTAKSPASPKPAKRGGGTKARFVVVTGGVCSSLGKGIATAVSVVFVRGLGVPGTLVEVDAIAAIPD